MLSWCINFLQWYFLCQFPGNFFDFNNTLINIKKNVILNLSTFWSVMTNLRTAQWLVYGFTYINLKATVLSFSLNSCFENFWKFTWKGAGLTQWGNYNKAGQYIFFTYIFVRSHAIYGALGWHVTKHFKRHIICFYEGTKT